MIATGIDEQRVATEAVGGNFVVFFYEGGDEPDASWSVDSYLLTDCDLPAVLAWLQDHLPPNCCWSLGTVLGPPLPTGARDVHIAWVVGADVLNVDRPDENESRLASEMLARRHSTALV
jgi:hypothetical protein